MVSILEWISIANPTAVCVNNSVPTLVETKRFQERVLAPQMQGQHIQLHRIWRCSQRYGGEIPPSHFGGSKPSSGGFG